MEGKRPIEAEMERESDGKRERERESEIERDTERGMLRAREERATHLAGVQSYSSGSDLMYEGLPLRASGPASLCGTDIFTLGPPPSL